MLSDVKVAKAIVKIFDLVSADTREWGSNAHSVLETRMAQGTASPELDRLLSRTPLIAAEIALSRIFSRYAGMWKACM